MRIELTENDFAALTLLKSTGVPPLEAAQLACAAIKAGRGKVKRALRCIAAGAETLKQQERTVTFEKAVAAALEAAGMTTPLLVGGAINWYVTTRSKDAELNAARGEKGTLLASGFIAGGALMGVVSATMRFGGVNLVNDAWLNNSLSELLALGAYAMLILYFVKASLNTKK